MSSKVYVIDRDPNTDELVVYADKSGLPLGKVDESRGYPQATAAEVERLRQQVQWKPFDTAPKDGTEVIVYRPDAGVFTAVYTHAVTGDEKSDDCYWFTAEGEDLTDDLPTHWMPLPQGPDVIATTQQTTATPAEYVAEAPRITSGARGGKDAT